MCRPLLPLLLPALLFAACGQTPAATPGATTPGATTPGMPAQQALPGVFQIDFSGVGTDAPTSSIQSLHPGGLGAQGFVSAPDYFSFSAINVQTFATPDTGIRHIRVTYKVTNTSPQTLRNPKFVAVVPQGSTTDSVFTNARYFDGTDASAAISRLSLVQAQSFDASTGTVAADPKTTPLLTGLDVSGVDTTGKDIKALTQTGWELLSGGNTVMASGDSALITFGVNVPMTAAADGGAKKDPFSFSLNVTAVQDAPRLALSSAVKQWDAARKTFGNYLKFPTQTYTENGAAITRSLPAYYDVNDLDGLTDARVICAGDANMSVTNISTADFPNRWRVQLFSPGDHTLKVFAGTNCATDAIPLVSQTVTGVATGGTSLAGGTYHSLALKADGTVQGWGLNNSGRLGDGTTTNRLTPVAIPGLSGITSLAVGDGHSLALKADGTAWSWGLNSDGQLGDGTTTNRLTPVRVTGLSDVVSLAASSNHTLALKADGTVWSWGWNGSGQLGNGTTTSRNTPAIIIGLGGVTSIAAGNAYSLASKADGTAWSWGRNGSGQLGDGTANNRNTPTAIPGLSGVTSVAGGNGHSLALKADGTAWSWGYNDFGQLGDGTTTSRTTPAIIPGLSGITSLAAGAYHSLLLESDGTVQSWGWNNDGELGDGTTTNRNTPVTVTGLSRVMQPTP